ncbi:PREDICTED: probable carboxylesterase 2 [Nelumbo nucifera]|uniref:Alpha/beta hydrolase fold-3 domain-containing protein n=2 Tax=Nelumbo nucifera TaxID=4432 RepID=A0A822Y5P6_NELNU|nr:PREDICTED: probable carboxylesterase 2 [Nelumbo nucifera]DAD27343.1 TPA_asm: hypothetical protein HUJ06_028811 [Nelumbo nucifera]
MLTSLASSFLHRHHRLLLVLMDANKTLPLLLLFLLLLPLIDSSSTSQQIDYQLIPFFIKYKDGHVKRLIGNDIIVAGLDPQTGVSTKDVTINTKTEVGARIYLPKTTNQPDQKLPLLVYVHGGAFIVETAFSPTYHFYLNSVVAQANVVAVSVNYRRAPENPLPIAYDDSWEVLKWAVSHSTDHPAGGPEEPWLKDHVDFERVFLAGDSAGANIVHNLAMRAGEEVNELPGGVEILGAALICPYFWGEKRIGNEAQTPENLRMLADKTWQIACPTSKGLDDPRINPEAEGAPSLSKLGCSRVLVEVAGKDVLKDRGVLYYDTLVKSGWKGKAELMESDGENHVFYLMNPTTEHAVALMKRFTSFLNVDTED